MLGKPYNPMLKAYTGLEGGLVARGSTCGVMTGGAAGIALMHADALSRDRPSAESAIMSLIQDYARWFDSSYGSCLCRQRTGVDFHSLYGQARYFFPGDKTTRCLWHIRGAARYLHELKSRPLSALPTPGGLENNHAIHCAGEVLAKIEAQTGLADEKLKQVAFIFDGGLGFSGGVCGALAGAILGVNLKLGMDIRDVSYIKTVQDFLVGHINLLRRNPPEQAEPFFVGNNVVRQFLQETGSIECAAITGKMFSGYPEFDQFISASETCRNLMDRAADLAVSAIKGLEG